MAADLELRDDALARAVELAKGAAVSKLQRDDRQLRGANRGGGTVAVGCEHHDSTFMAGFFSGICAALSVMTGRGATQLEQQALASAKELV